MGTNGGGAPETGTPAEGGGKTPLLRRVQDFLKARSLRQLATWVGLFGLLLTAPFGGWADARSVPPVAQPDQVIRTGPLDVTLNRVSASTRPAKVFSEAKDGTYLLVLGTVKSTSKVTLRDKELIDVVRLNDIAGLQVRAYAPFDLTAGEARRATPTVYYADDATTMFTVSPEMTYDVAWVWQRQGGAPPSSVDVVVNKFTWRQSSLQNKMGWLDPAPLTHVRLPVTVKPPYADPPTAGQAGPSPSPQATP